MVVKAPQNPMVRPARTAGVTSGSSRFSMRRVGQRAGGVPHEEAEREGADDIHHQGAERERTACEAILNPPLQSVSGQGPQQTAQRDVCYHVNRLPTGQRGALPFTRMGKRAP